MLRTKKKGAGPKPSAGGELQQAVEAATGRKFYRKTAGMTLYHYSRDGIVRREGHDWYFVPENQRKQPASPLPQREAAMSE